MDEHKLTELFREAVRDTPPASFDERDVAHASQRIAQRRRRSAAVGASIAAVLVFGVVAVGLSQLIRPQTSASSGASVLGPAAANPGPFTVEGSPSEQRAPKSGEKASGDVAAAQACGPVDRDLADALAAALPAAAGQQPVPVVGPCPPGARAAGYVVRDGATTGVFSVVLAPAGNSAPSTASSRPPGTTPLHVAVCIETGCNVTTASGKQLTVRSTPNPGSATAPTSSFAGPFADREAAVAQQLASRF